MTEVGLDDDRRVTTELGHRMLEEMMEFVHTVRERPVWTAPPAEVKRELARADPPLEGTGLEASYEDFKRMVLPFALGNLHPRFWGWVIGASSPAGMLTEMLAAGLNANVFGADDASTCVEAQVIGWFKSLFGFPESASGLLVSSGSMANLVALTVARDRACGGTVIDEGMRQAPALVAYCSRETHNSNDKAASMLGLGRRHLRRVATTSDYKIDVAELRTAIARDRAAGLSPYCLIANCGTVNTGQIDDLPALRRLADEEGLWLHVDGAFGALLRLSPRHQPLVQGIERADSVAFDLHKWMNMPYDAACVLVRDGAAHGGSFSPPASYLTRLSRGIAAGSHRFGELGPDLSRRGRGISIWMLLKTFGIRRFAQIIEQNVEQAHLLGRLVDASPDLELLTPVVTNCVCFRFRVPGMPETGLNALNEELLMRLQESGLAAPSSTMLAGRFALRVAIVNHRTRTDDIEQFLGDVVRTGGRIALEHARSES